MQRLIIYHVGPVIKADIKLKKVNVFIGPQSSGKSTVAKIISFCSWLEKNKHELEESELFAHSVIDKMTSYHRMEGYFSAESKIFYQGDNIAFAYNWLESESIPMEFEEGHYELSHLTEKEYFFLRSEKLMNPKVLYIPAERNFVSVVPNLQKYDESKDSLQSFVMDWFEAKRSFKKENALNLIDLGMKYYCDDDEDRVQLEDGHSIKLRNASSGLQSVIPLLIVADYMTKGIYEKERPFSVEEQDALNKLLQSLADESKLANNETVLKRRLLGFLQGKVYSHTQFVIEEPEQNLYPSEQNKLMEHLASIINHGKQHRLTLTTHSPYIVNFLNVLLRRSEKSASFLRPEELNVFLIANGELTDLMMHDDSRTKWGVDVSVLNAAMEDILDEFEELAK
ncbi:MAG: AAA family ATPase [Alloprevotella sp.]